MALFFECLFAGGVDDPEESRRNRACGWPSRKGGAGFNSELSHLIEFHLVEPLHLSRHRSLRMRGPVLGPGGVSPASSSSPEIAGAGPSHPINSHRERRKSEAKSIEKKPVTELHGTYRLQRLCSRISSSLCWSGLAAGDVRVIGGFLRHGC